MCVCVYKTEILREKNIAERPKESDTIYINFINIK